MPKDKTENKLQVESLVPLKWPKDWTRTPISERKPQAAWKKSLVIYEQGVTQELSRLGAVSATISHHEAFKERLDPGVAIWFALKKKEDFSWQTGLHLDSPMPTLEEIERAYKQLTGKHHPDAVANGSGGDVEIFYRLAEWREQARAWIQGKPPAQEHCIALDRFNEIRLNLAAIRLALSHFRGLERVGSPAILERVMERAFKTALPAHASSGSGEILL